MLKEIENTGNRLEKFLVRNGFEFSKSHGMGSHGTFYVTHPESESGELRISGHGRFGVNPESFLDYSEYDNLFAVYSAIAEHFNIKLAPIDAANCRKWAESEEAKKSAEREAREAKRVDSVTAWQSVNSGRWLTSKTGSMSFPTKGDALMYALKIR